MKSKLAYLIALPALVQWVRNLYTGDSGELYSLFFLLCALIAIRLMNYFGEDSALLKRMEALEKKSLVPDAMEKVVTQLNAVTTEQTKLKEALAKLSTTAVFGRGMGNG